MFLNAHNIGKEHSLLYHNIPRITDHLSTLSLSAKCQENPPGIVTTNMSVNFGDVGGTVLCGGAALCVVECLAASLAPTHWMSVALLQL